MTIDPTAVAALVLSTGGLAYWFGYRRGLISQAEAVQMAVMNSNVTELAERLNTLGRGMAIQCPKCGGETNTKLGEIPRTPLTEENMERNKKDKRKTSHVAG